MKKLAIVGAGLSGLVLANELKNLFRVTVFEKSRSVGGRLATRYSEDYEFDHGIPFFYAKNKYFIDFVNEIESNGIVKSWNAKFVEFDSNKIIRSSNWNKSYPHYVGVPKMNSIAKYLARDLDIKLNTRIAKVIKKNNIWQLFCTEKNSYDNFDWLIMAIPIAQAREVTSSYSENLTELNNIKMTSCCSLMLGFKKNLDLDFDAALVKNADISWVGINSTKPERKKHFSMVVLSTNKWAEVNIDKENSLIIDHLIKEASFILNKSLNKADYVDLHKWRYANAPKVKLSPLIYKDTKIAFCGDWAVKGVLEGAYLSARNVFTELKKLS